MSFRKIVVYVPKGHADKVREAIGKTGGGKIGNYSFCSFSSVGTGRFLPEKGARPAIGKIGKLQKVREEKIEITCEAKLARGVIEAIRAAHPYEEPAIDVWSVEGGSQL